MKADLKGDTDDDSTTTWGEREEGEEPAAAPLSGPTQEGPSHSLCFSRNSRVSSRPFRVSGGRETTAARTSSRRLLGWLNEFRAGYVQIRFDLLVES